MEETTNQLRNSQLRCAELQQRLQSMKEQTQATPEEKSPEELKRRIEILEGEETKVLRRLYLLVKQLRSSFHSECMTRVAEVLSQNATICITEDAVERLSPFSNEPCVQLLRTYLK